MTYNWEEIFKEKSTKELYEIYSGKSMLQNSAIPFAKRELENRNFDFADIEKYKELWKVESIEENQTYLQMDLQTRIHFTFKEYVFFTLFLILLFLVFHKRLGFENVIVPIIIPIIILISSFIVLLDNFIYKKRTGQIQKLNSEKKAIINKTKNQEVLKDNADFKNELGRAREKNYKDTLLYHRIILIISLCFLVFYLIFKYIASQS